MFKQLIARIGKMLRSRYVASIEEDVARLRAENRALLNSLLGTAGVPPIDPQLAHGPMEHAVRRRSWPQIATSREVAEVRRAEASRKAAATARS